MARERGKMRPNGIYEQLYKSCGEILLPSTERFVWPKTFAEQLPQQLPDLYLPQCECPLKLPV